MKSSCVESSLKFAIRISDDLLAVDPFSEWLTHSMLTVLTDNLNRALGSDGIALIAPQREPAGQDLEDSS